jgi:hypothetical protein
MKQTLRWFITSLILGSILGLAHGPSNATEAFGLILLGTTFFLGMLIGMLGAKENN